MPPPDDRVEGHVPREADNDDGQQNGSGDREVSPAVRCFEALQNRPDLQANEDERQDVQRENDGLPHGIGRYSCPCGNSLRRRPRYRHGATHGRQHT